VPASGNHRKSYEKCGAAESKAQQMKNKSILHSKLGSEWDGWLGEKQHPIHRAGNSIKLKNAENIMAYLQATAVAAVYVCKRGNSNISIVGQVVHGLSQNP